MDDLVSSIPIFSCYSDTFTLQCCIETNFLSFRLSLVPEEFQKSIARENGNKQTLLAWKQIKFGVLEGGGGIGSGEVYIYILDGVVREMIMRWGISKVERFEC